MQRNKFHTARSAASSAPISGRLPMQGLLELHTPQHAIFAPVNAKTLDTVISLKQISAAAVPQPAANRHKPIEPSAAIDCAFI